jgi:murein DD-endopeptidase MepM/ murein hydrolase activator NlpD
MGTQVTAGQQVGVTSSANHTHWEVRSNLVPDFADGETNIDNNSDPVGWLTLAAIGAGTLLVVGGSALLLWLLLRRRQ